VILSIASVATTMAYEAGEEEETSANLGSGMAAAAARGSTRRPRLHICGLARRLSLGIISSIP